MKTLNFLSIGLILLFFTTACNSGGGQEATAEADSTLVKMDVTVSPAMAAQTDSLLQAYYQLKDALVESDSVAAIKAAGILLHKTNKIPLEEIADSSKRTQVQMEITGLQSELVRLQQSRSLARIRSAFEMISGATYRLVKSTGLRNVTVYRTYCPMAFDDKGAYWLSNSSAIRNPYFGHKMINCGIVKETLQF